MISYVLSLRGNKGLMLGLTRLVKEKEKMRKHVVIPLKGKVKEEYQERDHLFPCSKKTASGMDVSLCIGLLIATHKLAGINGGLG